MFKVIWRKVMKPYTVTRAKDGESKMRTILGWTQTMQWQKNGFNYLNYIRASYMNISRCFIIRNFENFKVKLNKPDRAWFRSEANWCWSHVFSCISRFLSHASFPSIKKRIWHLLNDWINIIPSISEVHGPELGRSQNWSWKSLE